MPDRGRPLPNHPRFLKRAQADDRAAFKVCALFIVSCSLDSSHSSAVHPRAALGRVDFESTVNATLLQSAVVHYCTAVSRSSGSGGISLVAIA